MLKHIEFWKQIIEEALEKQAEYNFLDFKLRLSYKNERIKEHINAFGNLERGGCFVFGVENYEVKGVEDNWDATIQKISHVANNTQEPSIQIDAFPLKIQTYKLLCVHVLPSKSKPVFIKDRAPLGGKACYKRTGSSTVPMSIEEIKNLLINSTDSYFDESLIEDETIDSLAYDKLVELLPDLDKIKLNSSKNLALLMDCQILSGIQNNPKITVAGWLCFAKNPQSHRQFRNAYIELQIFKGVSRNTPIKKYEIKGNLPEQIENSVALLQQYIWSMPKIQGVKREDIPAYQRETLREVIANSLVHRDYRKMHQPVKISMFTNRIEVENPGGLMPGLTIFNLIHKRDWRNPLLAELMKKFGFGEMDGQGIDRLYAATLLIKVPPPIFNDYQTSFKVTLSAPKAFEEFTPDEKSLMIIILAIMNTHVDNESVRNALGISLSKASTLIKSMVSQKILEPSSTSRKYAKYILSKTYREKVFE